MTEAEWLTCADPTPMLVFLRGKASDRKLRLMACGCCRSVWREADKNRSSRAVELAERYADGEIARKEMVRAGETARAATRLAWKAGRQQPDALLHGAARSAAFADAFHAAVCAADAVCRAYEGITDHKPSQAQLLRDIFGNPFRPAAFAPAWRTPTAVSLAQAAYDERILPSGELEPARLYVLADALEEAGCASEAILSHLRSPGPHVRGCWALDLVLGKE